MIFFARLFVVLLPTIGILSVYSSNALEVDSDATRLLKQRTAEFDKDIIKVSESVYTAVGYGVSPVSMIVGTTGVVIVDTGISIDLSLIHI